MSLNTDSVPATNTNAEGVEPWKLALAIGLIYPYGLYLLWNHPTLSSNKWWWRCAIAWPVVFSLMRAPFNTKKERSQVADTATDAQSLSLQELRELEPLDRPPVSRAVDGGDVDTKASPFGEQYDQGFILGKTMGLDASQYPNQALRTTYNLVQKWRDEAVDNALRGGPDIAARYAQGRLDGFVQAIGSRVKELQ